MGEVQPKQNDYREYNKELAAAITRHIGIDDKYIFQGIKSARLACRFEIIQDKPIVVLDGAHNRSKIKTTIDNLKRLNFRKLHLIIGIADNKDHISIVEQIIPEADHIFFTRFQNKDRKCAHPKELFEKSKQYLKKGTQSEIYLDPENALTKALKIAQPNDLLLVTGSFFLAGEFRRRWHSEEKVLGKRRSF